MKSRGLLLTPDNLRAIHEDRKTQTRRIMIPQPDPRADWIKSDLNDIWRAGTAVGEIPQFGTWRCPFGKVGDQLWVREATWQFCEKCPNGLTEKGRQKWHYKPLAGSPVFYCADHPEKPTVAVVHPETGNPWLWRKKNARFMPKTLTRTTLEITGIRGERLKSISHNDCIAEGIRRVSLGSQMVCFEVNQEGLGYDNAQAAYRALWESIHGPGSWEANPFDWVLTFKKL